LVISSISGSYEVFTWQQKGIYHSQLHFRFSSCGDFLAGAKKFPVEINPLGNFLFLGN